MAIELDDGTTGGSSIPTVRLYEKGATVGGNLVLFTNKSMQAQNYNTQELEFWDNGTPKYLTELFIMTDTVENSVLDKDSEVPAVRGDVCRIVVEGSSWFEWKDALAAFKEAGNKLSTDTHILWVYDRDEPSSNPRYNDKKVKTFTLVNRPGSDSARAAEEAHASVKAVVAARGEDTLAAASASAAVVFDNEQPF